MKKVTMISLVIFCMGLAMPQAHALKIAFVDVQQALASVKAAKTAQKKVQTEIAARQKQLDAKRKELMDLEEAFKKQEMVLTEAKKKEKKEEFLKKAQGLQQALGQHQQEMQQVEQKLLTPILENMSSLLETIAKEKGYDMVLTKSALLYADSAQDFTEELIKLYDKKYK